MAEGYDEKNRSHERWEVELLNSMQKKLYSSSRNKQSYSTYLLDYKSKLKSFMRFTT